jgi:hypothetical protein
LHCNVFQVLIDWPNVDTRRFAPCAEIGPDQGAYYHPHFLRGLEHRDQCRFIRRIKVKGLGPRKPSSPASEPNFYKFPPLGARPSIGATRAIGCSRPNATTPSGTPRASPPVTPHVGVRGGDLLVSSGRFASLDSSTWTPSKVAHLGMAQGVGGPIGPCFGSRAWLASTPPQALWNMAADSGSFPAGPFMRSGRFPGTAATYPLFPATTAGSSLPFTKLRASQLFAIATAIAAGDATEEGLSRSLPSSRGPWLASSGQHLRPVGPGALAARPMDPSLFSHPAAGGFPARLLGLPSE